MLLFSCSFGAFANSQTAEESAHFINVQAALIKKFTHLIEWPKDKTKEENMRFNLCIYRSNALEKQFKTIFSTKQIKGKDINIINVSQTGLHVCHLVYISSSPKTLLSRVLENAHELGILTISSQRGYGEQGIHINFYEKDQHIAFELNKHALDRAGFIVSAQLYRYARIVE